MQFPGDRAARMRPVDVLLMAVRDREPPGGSLQWAGVRAHPRRQRLAKIHSWSNDSARRLHRRRAAVAAHETNGAAMRPFAQWVCHGSVSIVRPSDSFADWAQIESATKVPAI